jgi:hypothetical protein
MILIIESMAVVDESRGGLVAEAGFEPTTYGL